MKRTALIAFRAFIAILVSVWLFTQLNSIEISQGLPCLRTLISLSLILIVGPALVLWFSRVFNHMELMCTRLQLKSGKCFCIKCYRLKIYVCVSIIRPKGSETC